MEFIFQFNFEFERICLRNVIANSFSRSKLPILESREALQSVMTSTIFVAMDEAWVSIPDSVSRKNVIISFANAHCRF